MRPPAWLARRARQPRFITPNPPQVLHFIDSPEALARLSLRFNAIVGWLIPGTLLASLLDFVAIFLLIWLVRDKRGQVFGLAACCVATGLGGLVFFSTLYLIRPLRSQTTALRVHLRELEVVQRRRQGAAREVETEAETFARNNAYNQPRPSPPRPAQGV